MKIEDCLNIKTFIGDPKSAVYDQLLYALNESVGVGYNMEFGVFRGDSINFMAEKYKEGNHTFYGFDSFDGLPEQWRFGNKIIKKGHFSLGGKLPKVKFNVKLFPGWFNDSIPAWKDIHPNIINFMHIDSDLYSSAKTILTLLEDRIVPGTVLVFDDFCDFRLLQGVSYSGKAYHDWRDGEYRAFNEWLNKYNRKVEPISRTYRMSIAFKVTQ